jgi:hypothetical protein
MTDPRLVRPQRVPTGPATDTEACAAHRYWCAKRVTAVVVALILAVVVLTVGLWWWVW